MQYDIEKDLKSYFDHRSWDHILTYDFQNYISGSYPLPVPPALMRRLEVWQHNDKHPKYAKSIRQITLGLWLHFGQLRYEISSRKFIDFVHEYLNEEQRELLMQDLITVVKKIDLNN